MLLKEKWTTVQLLILIIYNMKMLNTLKAQLLYKNWNTVLQCDLLSLSEWQAVSVAFMAMLDFSRTL